MEQQSSGYGQPVEAPAITEEDRLLDDGARFTAVREPAGRRYMAGTSIGVEQNVLPVRNRVQWGPIIAGSLAALGSLLLLTVLGIAIGLSAIEPGAKITDWGTGAGIWGGASVLIALFIGGWVAAKTAAVEGSFAGMMNGLICGLATVFGVLVAAALGLTNALGFLGANLSNLANFTNQATTNGTVTSNGAFNDIEHGAWGTLLALVLGFGAAALGGLLARHERQDLIDGTG